MSHPQGLKSEHLVDCAAAVYAGGGMPADDARLIADTLVQADLSEHTLTGAREGFVTLLTRNGGAMAPWGGMKTIVGTNPWSVAAPAGRHPPLVMDMANTGVARGKIYLARNKHLPITRSCLVEAAPVSPTVTMIANQNWIEFALRCVVDYKLRRATKDRLFLRIREEIDQTAEKVGIAASTLNIEKFAPLNVRISRAPPPLGAH